MEENAIDKNNVISKFNEAGSQINRLSWLWQQCNALSGSGEYLKWKWELDKIWRELYPDAANKENEDNKAYTKQNKLINMKIGLAEKRNIPSLMYQVLQEKELFLRKLADEVGKGGKRGAAEDDDF